jgi:hypothetical protein
MKTTIMLIIFSILIIGTLVWFGEYVPAWISAKSNAKVLGWIPVSIVILFCDILVAKLTIKWFNKKKKQEEK